MSSAVNLIQVLLPDSTSILSASIATDEHHQPTISNLISALLSDPANSTSLYSVFGSEYDPNSITDSDQDGDIWWIDAKSMSWAIQVVEVSPANKEWSQEELDHLGDGLLPLSTPIFPFLHALLLTDNEAKLSHKPLYAAANGQLDNFTQSGFSDFSLSSHLHKPRLRLVCGAPGLSVRLQFAHIPEIYDGWDGRVFFLPGPWDGVGPASGEGTRVSEVIEAICEELGIRRVVLQGSKSARVEYALADITMDQISMPPPPPLNVQICLPEHLITLPGPPEAYPSIYFTISAKWLSRLGTVALGFSKHARKNAKVPAVIDKQQFLPINPANEKSSPKQVGVFGLWGMASVSKATAPALTSTGDSELDALSSEPLDVGEDDVETETTVKEVHVARKKAVPATHTATARLSRMFEGWISTYSGEDPDMSSPSSPLPADKERPTSQVSVTSSSVPRKGGASQRKSISSPISSPMSPSSDWPRFNHAKTDDDENDDNLEARFEQLMQELGIKGASRTAMIALPEDRKKFLIAQNEAAKCTPCKSKIQNSNVTGQCSTSPDHTSALADTISKASTALVWGNRFSIASIAGWTGEASTTLASSPPTSSSTRESFPSSRMTSVTSDSDESEVVKPTSTGTSGNLWTSWWGASSDTVEKDDPSYYSRIILTSKLSRKDLVKTLISLRVTLSSAKLIWISAFLDERGLKALEYLLQIETQPLANNTVLEMKEMSNVILNESVKCLRTLMNTEVRAQPQIFCL